MPLGEPVEKGEVIARVHAATDAAAEQATAAVIKAMRMSEQRPEELPLIYKRIG